MINRDFGHIVLNILHKHDYNIIFALKDKSEHIR